MTLRHNEREISLAEDGRQGVDYFHYFMHTLALIFKEGRRRTKLKRNFKFSPSSSLYMAKLPTVRFGRDRFMLLARGLRSPATPYHGLLAAPSRVSRASAASPPYDCRYYSQIKRPPRPPSADFYEYCDTLLLRKRCPAPILITLTSSPTMIKAARKIAGAPMRDITTHL